MPVDKGKIKNPGEFKKEGFPNNISCFGGIRKNSANSRKRLDFNMESVLNLTSDMEVGSFFYARKPA